MAVFSELDHEFLVVVLGLAGALAVDGKSSHGNDGNNSENDASNSATTQPFLPISPASSQAGPLEVRLWTLH
jgi:hypothetical protein